VSKANVSGEVLGKSSRNFPVVSEDDMLRKPINESSEPVEGRLGMEESRGFVSDSVLDKECGLPRG
jgi:hypothetical protein